MLERFDEFDGAPVAKRAPREAPPAFFDAPDPAADARAFLDGLYAKRDAYLERDRFATIGDADEFFTKVMGVTFEGRQDLVAGLSAGDALELERQPANPHDANAIAVRFGTLHIGYLRREIARRIAPAIDAGARYSASVGSVTGGVRDKNVGVNILVRRVAPHGGFDASSNGAVDGIARRGVRGAADRDAIVRALIGEREIRRSQRDVLERVAGGRNTLAVLGTGRGKSFCFQLPAAERALGRGEKTLVLYPLRALANDQFDALRKRLGPLGVRVLRANGAIDGVERAELDAALADGSWDIVLATPEFATYHREAFERACNRPSLLVIDEAHHVHDSKHRPAYGALPGFVAALDHPQVLALTATASEAAFREIREALAIDAWAIDPTVRENLSVIDARNTKDKFAYLVATLDASGKAIVYCNSRNEATKLAERLRASVGPAVAFYHAGVAAPERVQVEDYFRSGAIRVVVATSAFGEGIDLPDVRDVVLYHLNFDFTEFNQQSGRAGRDGEPARIHLLYGEADRRINDYIIARGAPTLETLRALYRGMRRLASDDVLRMTYVDIARTLDHESADESTVSAALKIWSEASLVEVGVDDDGRFVRFLEPGGKVDLTATTRFAEGAAERDAFERFCTLALAADAESLRAIINRPIYPDRVPLLR